MSNVCFLITQEAYRAVTFSLSVLAVFFVFFLFTRYKHTNTSKRRHFCVMQTSSWHLKVILFSVINIKDRFSVQKLQLLLIYRPWTCKYVCFCENLAVTIKLDVFKRGNVVFFSFLCLVRFWFCLLCFFAPLISWKRKRAWIPSASFWGNWEPNVTCTDVDQRRTQHSGLVRFILVFFLIFSLDPARFVYYEALQLAASWKLQTTGKYTFLRISHNLADQFFSSLDTFLKK